MSGIHPTRIPPHNITRTPLGSLPLTSVYFQSNVDSSTAPQPLYVARPLQHRQTSRRPVRSRLQRVLRAIARLLPQFRRVSRGSDNPEARGTYATVLGVLREDPQRWARLMGAREQLDAERYESTEDEKENNPVGPSDIEQVENDDVDEQVMELEPDNNQIRLDTAGILALDNATRRVSPQQIEETNPTRSDSQPAAVVLAEGNIGIRKSARIAARVQACTRSSPAPTIQLHVDGAHGRDYSAQAAHTSATSTIATAVSPNPTTPGRARRSSRSQVTSTKTRSPGAIAHPQGPALLAYPPLTAPTTESSTLSLPPNFHYSSGELGSEREPVNTELLQAAGALLSLYHQAHVLAIQDSGVNSELKLKKESASSDTRGTASKRVTSVSYWAEEAPCSCSLVAESCKDSSTVAEQERDERARRRKAWLDVILRNNRD
ncbi:hypothetical protein BDZ91DRAFT_795113 [Kalaharituber pfeilii]|nr:hypothetical protein BDZ91DRAFT_795113 [Kalaharituber pfeilii]